MARVNSFGYVERGTSRNQNNRGNCTTWRDWWLIGYMSGMRITQIYFPKRYIGKRVRLKIEVIE